MVRNPNTRCNICSKPVYRRPSLLEKSEGRAYCNRTCYGLSTRKLTPCPVCGEGVSASRKRKTCSDECSILWNKSVNRKHSLGRRRVDKVKWGTRGFRKRFMEERSIEDGLDFEKTIADILNRCKSSDEIEHAFDELEKQFEGEITQEMAKAKAKVFDNLDPNVQDRLKSYDAQSGEVLNKFERLLLSLTKHQLSGVASFEGDGRLFDLHTSPAPEIKTGRYFFKSKPQDHAHQYRFASPLAEHVVAGAKGAECPPYELTFSLHRSERVPAALKALEGKSGQLTCKLVTFRMKAGNEDISESYPLAGMLTDEGKWYDHEYVADLMDLTCTETSDPVTLIDEKAFTPHLEEQRQAFEKEVQARNARHYDQQEELLYRNSLDRKAESEALIREYRQKEKESRKAARQTDDPLEQLRHKKDARRWAQKAEDEDDRARTERIKLRDESDKYLDLIEQALRGSYAAVDLFNIRWRITA